MFFTCLLLFWQAQCQGHAFISLFITTHFMNHTISRLEHSCILFLLESARCGLVSCLESILSSMPHTFTHREYRPGGFLGLTQGWQWLRAYYRGSSSSDVSKPVGITPHTCHAAVAE